MTTGTQGRVLCTRGWAGKIRSEPGKTGERRSKFTFLPRGRTHVNAVTLRLSASYIGP
jgi:hypothetical protein